MTIIFLLYFPVLLSLSLSFMINLFKNNIHSFLGSPSALHTTATADYKLHHHPISSIAGVGLGLITATSDVYRSPNVVQSATLKLNTPPAKRDSGGIGSMFVDDIGGGVDGLMSCTESLGFESSDERRVDDHQMHHVMDNEEDLNQEIWRSRMRTAEGRGNWRNKTLTRSFPPPLSTLNRNGQPSFFLRPVRKDGRLELTEVRIHRPEILHASRHDGRLTLRLIPDTSILIDDDDDIEEEEEFLQEAEEEEEEEAAAAAAQLEEEEQEEEELLQKEKEEEEELEEEIIEEEEEEVVVVVEEIRYGKEEERAGKWRFPMGGSEGFRRCHEVVNPHHHHHHHVHGSHHPHHHHLRMCGVSIV